MQILIGAYIRIRNTNAHSLLHDLDDMKPTQYFILASLLARRVTEVKAPGLSLKRIVVRHPFIQRPNDQPNRFI